MRASATTTVWATFFYIVTLQSVATLTASLYQSNVYCGKVEGGNCEASAYQCKECETLMWFVTNRTESFGSNKTMYFLQGEHSLTSSSLEAGSGLVNIINVTNFAMEGYENVTFDPQHFSPVPKSRVVCKNFEGGFLFLDSVEVSIN